MDTTNSPLAFAAGEESRVVRSAEFSGAPIPLPSLIAVPNDTDNPEALKFDRIIGYSKHGCSYRYTGFCGVPEQFPSAGNIAVRQMAFASGQQLFDARLRRFCQVCCRRMVASGPVAERLVFRARDCGLLLVARRKHHIGSDDEYRCSFGENGPFHIDKGDEQFRLA